MTPEEQKKQAEEHKNAVQRATNASLENFHLEDPWRSRLLRFLAKVAGLPMPLNENDYNYQLKRANGDPIKIQTDFCSHPENFGNAVVLNTHSVPFDMYSLCKSGHIIFILSLVSLYIFLISTFFALLSKWAGCITFEGANWLAKGFLIVSGMGNGLDQSTKCMYIDCFAVMIGVYVSLPIFGAVVLVRLLDWTSNHIKASKKVLLSMRDGKPIIMVRCGE